jgi:sugar/nucleoside kinase (ribokinase family)
MADILAVGIGHPTADLLINIDKLPQRDGDAQLLGISYQYGGKVPTAMAALGRLGVPCGCIGVVGSDDEGRAVCADLQRNGVDASHMVVLREPGTSLNVSLSEAHGGRNIIKRARGLRGVEPADLDRDYITQARVLHLSRAGEAEILAAGWMHEAGGLVAFDADGYTPEIEAMLGQIDAFIASEFYYTKRYGDADLEACCREIATRGPAIVVITLGSRGCVGLSGGRFFRLPVVPVDAVDTTGAGDTFHGAFLYGLLLGWDAEACAAFASAVSAHKCSAIGGRAALPTLAMLERFRKDGFIDREEIERRLAVYSRPHGLQV